MILSKMFPEDSREIARMQSDVYGQSIRAIFEICQTEYIKAELILGIRTDLGKDLRNVDRVDHRTLQWLHDAIAGQFRFNCVNSHLSAQVSLFDKPHTNNDLSLDMTSQWRNFLESELSTIFIETPNLIKQICLAVTYSNPDERGGEAEGSIYRYTLMRYENLLAKKPTQLGLL